MQLIFLPQTNAVLEEVNISKSVKNLFLTSCFAFEIYARLVLCFGLENLILVENKVSGSLHDLTSNTIEFMLRYSFLRPFINLNQ